MRRDVAFWAGVVSIAAGTALHLPMYLRAAEMDFELAGMPMDRGMVAGMVLLVAGLGLTVYGLLPPPGHRAPVGALRVRALDDAPIGPVHIGLLLVMAAAVTIDVMKPTTLAFVVPGVAQEYGLRSPTNPTGSVPAALLPLAGITGTVLGSLLWGHLGDRIGRRSSMLFAGAIFTATSICGAMPSFGLNLVMCFIMGMGAGGMLPITFTLLSETIPARHRGWLMVLIGSDIAGAYVLTSWLSSWLQPMYGWRILWLIGFPTGLLLILLTRWVPESPRYLLSVGRQDEARAVLRRYGAALVTVPASEPDVERSVGSGFGQLLRPPFLGLTTILALAGLGTGLAVYGFQLWLPSNLRHLGFTGVTADSMLRDAALLGFPLSFAVAYAYHRSSRWTLIGLSSALALALGAFAVLGDRVGAHPAVLAGLLVVPIWGSASAVAVISAYSTEVYPTRIRSRGAGLAAAMAKAGGVVVIALVVAAAATPSVTGTALLGAVPMGVAALAAVFVLVETRGRGLEEITAAELQLARE
jgi:putative MFS transporter